jgi:predicted DsbA family dithiol-disulfide isomerase
MPSLQLDFISDIACPWCAVGLNGLERALEILGGDVDVALRFQPFELNPTMEREGADAAQYLKAKYGMDDMTLARNRATIRERGAAVGFAFGERLRVWNTFDAHRLLHWAGTRSAAAQRALKHALLQAYHGDGRNPGERAVLIELAATSGLDATEAARVFDEGRFADDVRATEREWQAMGIHAVPALVVNRRHLISGGQPPEVYAQALRQIAAEA